MALEPGRMLSHHRLVEQIGQGGMGVVWRAVDTRLDRQVALKILPEPLAVDPQRVARFEREAQAVAALNHPNIVTIHSVEHDGDVRFLTMELVRGRTLAELVPATGFNLSRFFELAIPIADAVTCAHEQGVTHRDLKPQNVMVTDDGRVKVLDFGLARLLAPEVEDRVANQGTVTLTQDGQVVGTVPYMSPEQLQGRPTDHRTDVFSLGVMFYEIATGRRPFRGGTAAETISSILRDAPAPLHDVDPTLPRQLGRIVGRCLEKESRRRFQTALDLRNELDALRVELTSASRPRAAGPAADRTALAVLPLANLCGGAEHDYFVDGMTEALITDLAKIGALKVISRTSAMQYKGVRKPLPEIGRELGVGAVVEGSVMRAGDRIRITAQLVDTSTDQHLWAESYDGDLHDVFALQSQVARAIAKEVRVKLTPEESARLSRARRIAPEAYEAYLRGRFLWNQRTDAALRKGIAHFNEAIALDPAYALAYVGLADTHNLFGWYFTLPPQEAFPKARAAARKALELDDSLAEAHNSLGYVAFYHDWDWAEAERSFRRALELNPSYEVAHQWYANLLCRGRLDEALQEVLRARELDPLSLIINAAVGFIHFMRRDYDRAIAEFRGIHELSPEFYTGRLWCGQAYLQKGMYDQALTELAHAARIAGQSPFARAELAHGHAVAGLGDEARAILAELLDPADERYVPAFLVGLIHCGLGEPDAAFEWLERALAERAHWLVFLDQDPRFDRLKPDPRFAGLLSRIERAPSGGPP